MGICGFVKWLTRPAGLGYGAWEVSPMPSRLPQPNTPPTPLYAVWEVTLRCNQACAHCGSRAGPSADALRATELDTPQLLDVAAQLIRLGTQEVTLIGGEAYLRPDLPELIHFLSQGGVRVTLQTGGKAFTPRLARALKGEGLVAVGVSVDGDEPVHDLLRANVGSYVWAMRALDAAREAGLGITANSQINRLNAPLLRPIAEALRGKGVRVWRCQLTVPMGRAADHPDWILEPYQVPEVLDTLAQIQTEAALSAKAQGLPAVQMFNVLAGNNLGYYGRHEILLRSSPGTQQSVWQGCVAGRYTLGIESDGVIKGCPSLPTAPYSGGRVQDLGLEAIWQHAEALRFARDRGREELWGFCAGCEYGDICRGGCSFTAHCTLGRRGNNPFCAHRAETLRKQGRRERLVQRQRAPGDLYDFGRFEIVEEDWPAQGEGLL